MPHPLDDFWPAVFGVLQGEIHTEEWARLQDRFWLRTGKPAQDDDTYEARMQAFQEWVFLDGFAPCRLARLLDQGRLPERFRDLAASLVSSHVGLLVLMAPWKQTAWFRDLLGGADFVVHEQPPIFGLVPGQTVQTRIFWHAQELRLTLGRVVHPENATESLHRLVPLLRARGFSDLDILHILMKMEWRARLHVRMNPVVFYDPSNPMIRDLIDSFPR